MSNPPDKLWTEEEKNFLLAEILKKAGISSAYLFSIVKERNIQPRWMEIPLPQGRSVHACQAAFERMEREYAPPQHRQSFPGLTAPQVPPGSRKRPLYPHIAEKSVPRPIQPKPPSARFLGPEIRTPIHMSPSAEGTMGEPPRKRGRPTKAEIERRTRIAHARGEQYPPVKRGTPRKPTTTESGPSERATLAPGIMPRPAEGQSKDSVPQMLSEAQAPPPERPAEQPNETPPQLAPRPLTTMGTGILPTPTATMGPGAATPRTIIMESPASAPAPSVGPTFRGINQPSSVPVGPTPDMGLDPGSGGVENGGEPVQPVPGIGGGRQP